MRTYEIRKRIIPEKKYRLPIFKDIPEREEWYFINESGVEMIATSLKEAEKLVKECKEYFEFKREVEESIKQRY